MLTPSQRDQIRARHPACPDVTALLEEIERLSPRTASRPRRVAGKDAVRTETPGLFWVPAFKSFYLDAERGGRRFTLSLRTRDHGRARLEVSRFELDPEGYAAARRRSAARSAEDLAAAYVAAKREVNRVSAGHLQALERVLGAWLAAAPGRARDWSRAHVEAFVRERSRRVGATTAFFDTNRLRGFLRWCLREGAIETDPSRDVRVKRPKVGATDRRRVVMLEEVRKLRFAGAPEMRAVTLALWGSGLRWSELERVDAAALKLVGERTVWVAPGKTDESREVPLADDAIALAFVEVVRLSAAGRLPDRDRYAEALAAECAAAGVARLTPHALRHSFATWQLRAGVPLELVQRMMGHKSVSTTRMYLHPTAGFTPPASGLLPSDVILGP